MTELRGIEIDFDVHRRIEAERRGFGESPNQVLRRLLGLDQDRRGRSATSERGRSWSGKGVTLPHGTELRMTYNNQAHLAQIDDGAWLAEGRRHRSPSGAACALARTRDGRRASLDGWAYWEARIPGSDRWVSLARLRAEAAIDEGLEDFREGRVSGPFESIEAFKATLDPE